MKKLEQNKIIGDGVGNNLANRTKSSLTDNIFGIKDSNNSVDSRVNYREINVEDITPRAINKYSQVRIGRLAQSIRNTNNRLIHPIILVKVEDLPAHHEVIVKMKSQGVDFTSVKYILVAGERRYRAWLLNRELEAKRIKDAGLIEDNIFDTITANILTKKEASSEKVFYQDSNNESRQLTPVEGLSHIKDVIKETRTSEDKRNALIEMNNGSEEDIPTNEISITRKFNQVKYIRYYLDNELGVGEGWSDSVIKAYLAVVNNCTEEIIDSVLKLELPATEARRLTGFVPDVQNELLRMYKENKQEYVIKMNAGVDKKIKIKKVVRFSHRDIHKEVSGLVKKIEESKSRIELTTNKLSRDDAARVKRMIKIYNQALIKIKELNEEFE